MNIKATLTKFVLFCERSEVKAWRDELEANYLDNDDFEYDGEAIRLVTASPVRVASNFYDECFWPKHTVINMTLEVTND